MMMSAYFSAILSTADSCLMAASGNIVTDILGRGGAKTGSAKKTLRISQGVTLLTGFVALLLASTMHNVLQLMLHSYAFLVSGLLVPLVAAMFGGQVSSTAAFWSMLAGGVVTVSLSVSQIQLPLGLDANIYGIAASAFLFVTVNSFTSKTSYAYD